MCMPTGRTTTGARDESTRRPAQLDPADPRCRACALWSGSGPEVDDGTEAEPNGACDPE
jgi:hypothetical protein